MDNRGSDVTADLHLHTLASDGTSTVDERVVQALDRNLDAIAITDHDRIADELRTRVERRDGLEVITGVEVRADVADTKVEILGYFVDPTGEELDSLLEEVRENRHRRNEAILSKLQDVADARLSYGELRQRADGIVGRPHIARALVDRGVVDTVSDAFGEYLGDDGRAFVEMERVSYTRVLEAIHDAGGVASLAHPGRIRSNSVERLVRELADDGLDAIEVWYPYGDVRSDDYADVGVAEADELAAEHTLLRTGGSDCHGPDSGKYRIGTVGVSSSELRELRSRAANRRPFPGDHEH